MLRVFLASRFEEFRALRQTLALELANRQVFAVNLDDERADERSARRRSVEELLTCDAVILLLGRTYGEPVHDGCSITHHEYLRAVDLGKPVFAYVHDDALEPEAQRFLDSVQREQVTSTIGEASEVETALRIVGDIQFRLGSGTRSSGEAEADDIGSAGSAAELAREADYLGFRDTWEGSTAGATAMTIRGRAAERTELAFHALRLDRADVAARHFEEALELHPLEWVPAYSRAWLAARAERRGALEPALRAAQDAVSTARHSVGIEGGRAHELGRRRLTSSRVLAGRLALAVTDYPEARHQLDAAIEETPWSRPALLQRLRLAALDIEVDGFELATTLAEQLLRTYPREFGQLLRSSDLRGIRGDLESALVDGLGEVSSAVSAAMSEGAVSLDDAIATYRREFITGLSNGRAAVASLLGRSSSLASDLRRAVGFDRQFATIEDASPAIAALETEREHESSRAAALAADLSGAPDVDQEEQHVRTRIDELDAEAAADASVEQELAAEDERAAQRLASYRRARVPVLTVIALGAVLGFSLGLLVQGWQLALLLGVLGTGFASWQQAALTPGVERLLTHSDIQAADRRGRHRADLASRAQARAEALQSAETHLTELDAERQRQASAVAELSGHRARIHELDGHLSVLRASVDLDVPGEHDLGRQLMRTAFARLARDKNAHARWAAVLAPSDYVPLRRCTRGDLTRVRSDDDGVTVTGGDPGAGVPHRLVRCTGREGRPERVAVSDLAVFADDGEQEIFSSFERFVLERPAAGGPAGWAPPDLPARR